MVRDTINRWGGIGRSISIFVSVLILTSCGSGQSNRIVITGGSLFDSVAEYARPNTGIIIEKDRIVAVDADLDEADLKRYRVIELGEDEFIMSGMFDLHAHHTVDLFGRGRVDETRNYPTIFLANGVTSVFSCGEMDPDRMRQARLRIERGEQTGPGMFNSGPYFGTARPGWNQNITAEEIWAEVDSLAAIGVGGLKAKGIRPEHLKPLIEAGHAHGLTVAGHLGSGYRRTVNPRDAILMGIDRVEHFLGGDALTADRSAYASLVNFDPGSPEFDRIAALYIDNGTYFDATMSAYGYYGKQDPVVFDDFAEELKYFTPYMQEILSNRPARRVNDQFETIYRVKQGILKAFFDAGGGNLITLGTDHSSWGQFISGFSVHRELHCIVLSGISEASALKIATINGARALGMEEWLGTIEPGKLADIVILEGNPLEDIRNTRRVRLVMKSGEIYVSRDLLLSVEGMIGPVSEEEEHFWGRSR